MSKTDFWDRVRHGAEKLGIADSTVAVWKHRGRVSRNQTIPLYLVLAGTEYEIALDELNSGKNHNSGKESSCAPCAQPPTQKGKGRKFVQGVA